MSPRAYQEIEDIETRLDACVRRIRELEDQVQKEVEQQNEDMRKLRGQLRRTIEAIAGAHRPAGDEHDAEHGAPPDEAEPAAPDAPADLLQEEATPRAPAAFVPDEAPPLADPFEAALPDAPQPARPAPAEHAEPVAGDEAPPEEPAWGGAFDAGASSDFIIPAEGFSSAFGSAPDPAPDPFAAFAPPAEEGSGEDSDSPEESNSLSAFNMLLDWSDFESDETAEDAPALHAGDGVTIAPASPPRHSERPVLVSRPLPTTDKATARNAAPATRRDAAPEVREGERDLTVIPGIDDEMQTALHRLGVTTLDEIAGWHRADAARVATQLGTVSESEIFGRWVLEAQTALFDLFQQRLHSARTQNLDEG